MNALGERTWFELRAAALAAGCRFNTQWTKQQAREQVYTQIMEPSRLRRNLRGLGQAERHALQRLQAAGGTLPLHRFTRDYGSIRPCRQRPHDAPKPWIAPHSPAERLWLAGFIEITRTRPQQICLTGEAAAILPPLPAPRPLTLPTLPAVESARAALCLDVAIFLGSLLAEDACPLSGCWLSPRSLRRITARLSQPDDLVRVRSERRAGRIAFIHYLALAAGLISVQDSFLKPTVAVWE
ncbi:MAG: hypothetical protein IAE80_04840 [Anaerolinea sp.]|nr:hypothetical protein [Anaerolinea sp.]